MVKGQIRSGNTTVRIKELRRSDTELLGYYIGKVAVEVKYLIRSMAFIVNNSWDVKGKNTSCIRHISNIDIKNYTMVLTYTYNQKNERWVVKVKYL